MKNNCCEESIKPVETIVQKAHSDLISNFKLPYWMNDVKCPYCKEPLPKTSLRSISLKLNPRNIGDVCIEFLCPKCEIGNTLYYVKEISIIQDLQRLLDEEFLDKPSSEPITEEEMYKQKYHNSLESLIKKEEK